MGIDPGASFVTDRDGAGEILVKLDFDLLHAAPVSNKNLIRQCVPQPEPDGSCPAPAKSLRVTTTWLRRFIAEMPLEARAATCGNYDARFDPDSPSYDAHVAHGQDARLWQCTDPATGLPRVPRFVFNHFRLANHPDDLTHGFIGGNGTDHWIDLVGRRCDVRPLPADETPCSN